MDKATASTSWIHYFDENFAVSCGLHEAIVYEHVKQWIKHNIATGQNQENGKTWTYNTKEGWQLELPFLTPNQVRVALDNLRYRGFLIGEHRSKKRWDRTLWYALSSKTIGDQTLMEQCPDTNPLVTEPVSSITTPLQDNISTTLPSPSAPAGKRRSAKHSPEEIALANELSETIQKLAGPWASYASEIAALYKLIEYSHRAAPDAWQDFLRTFFAKAWEMRKHDKWLKGKSYTPRFLLSAANAIAEAMKKRVDVDPFAGMK
jgi:hypothetical protein